MEEPTKTQATESPESIVVDEGADSEEKPDVMEEQTKIQTTELSESADVDVSDDSDDKIELMEEQMSQATESFDMVNVNLSANFEEKIELMVEQNQTQSTDFFESIDVNSSDDSEEEIKITEEQTLIQATESSDTVVIDGNHHFDDSTELMDEETQEIKVGEITMINCNDETGNQHVSQLQDELSHSTESYESEGENDTTYVNKYYFGYFKLTVHLIRYFGKNVVLARISSRDFRSILWVKQSIEKLFFKMYFLKFIIKIY